MCMLFVLVLVEQEIRNSNPMRIIILFLNMQLVKNYIYNDLLNMLLGNYVHFKSNCMFFPKEGVTGKVISHKFYNNELLFKLQLKSGKTIDIGSNTENLQFEILKRIS